ncbi:hypothetical protein SDC9_150923 [bioreactor metagenome]|uniref:Recombinase zinc beta ribbon domain-containing protein n=1 Tax=bioreactor metagenome TaxID=1076179 RepID=A0A645ENW2_9ZZZZ
MFLQNERYTGRAHGQDGFCEQLIDDTTFLIAQAAMAERAQRNSNKRSDKVYLFTGLTCCAECGNRLSAHITGGRYIYYRCTRYEKLHLCTHKKRTSELILEDWLLHNMLAQVAAFNATIEEAKAARPIVDEAKIKRKMEKLKDLYLNDLIDRAAYEADYTVLRGMLDGERENPLPRPIDIPAMRTALEDYKTLSRDKQKEFWSRTIKRIIITQDESFSVIPVSPYS